MVVDDDAWIEAAEACEAWVLDQLINHNRDWWLTPVIQRTR